MKRSLLTVLLLSAFVCLVNSTAFAQCDPLPTSGTSTAPDVGGIVCFNTYSPSDLVATSLPATPDDTNTADYNLVVTTTDVVDSLGNPTIVGLSVDGSFEFATTGNYCFSGFAYNQSEINDVATFLNDNETLLALVAPDLLPLLPLPSPLPLADLLAIAQGLSGGELTIPVVLDNLGLLDVLGLQLCFAIADTPDYCLFVTDDEFLCPAGPEPCLSYAGGPWSDQAIDVAGCDGETVSAPYEAWINEVYYTEVVEGGNYTFDMCNGAYDAANWGGPVVITVINGGEPNADNNAIEGGEVLLVSEGCTLDFDAPNDGTVWFILSTADGCGAATNNVDNGTPTVTTNSGSPDCGCTAAGVWVSYDEVEDQFSLAEVPSVFCPSVAGDTTEGVAYVAFAADGTAIDNSYTVSTDDGYPIYLTTANGFEQVDTIPGLIVAWLQFTQDDFDTDADGMTTITITGEDGACVAELVLDWTGFAGLNIAELCGVADPCDGIVVENDACDGAAVLDVTDGAINGPFDNTCATGEDMDIPGCFTDGEAEAGSIDASVWYTFMGDGSFVTLTTSNACATGDAINDDTQMTVYTGACDGLTQIACDDDIDVDTGNYMSTVSFATEAGMAYYVMVDGWNGTAGEFCIDVMSEAVNPCAGLEPANDACADAAAITAATNNGPFTNTCATVDGETAPADFEDGSLEGTVWLSLTGDGSTVTLTTNNDCSEAGAEVNIDTQIGVYAGCDGELVVANDDIDVDNQNYLSTVTFVAEAGVNYVVMVDGWNGANGEFCVDYMSEGGATCDASYGIATYTDATVICAGGATTASATADAAADGYTTVFVLTAGADLTIQGLPNGDGVFTITEAGDYTVHAFNYNNDDEETIVGALAAGGLTGGAVLGFIADGTICAALDAAGQAITVLAADDPACVTLDPLAVAGATVDIDEDSNTYVVTFTITGGSGDYSVDGDGNLVGGVFTSAPIACGTPYSFTATDNNTAETGTNAGDAPCEAAVADACDEISAGAMAADAQYVCFGGLATATNDGSQNVPDGADFFYALHTSPTADAGDILGTNTTGSFTFESLDITAQYNTDYYISAVVSATDNEGNACLSVAPGVLTVFLEEIQINAIISCDDNATSYEVSIEVTGGLPAYDSNQHYNIDGTISGTSTEDEGNPFSIGPILDGNQYIAEISDALGCSASVSEIPDCTKCPEDSFGDTPTGSVFVCDGGTASAPVTDYTIDEPAEGDPASFLGYILHTGDNTSLDEEGNLSELLISNIAAYSASGEFSIGGLSTNTVYYLSGVIGNTDDDANGVADIQNGCTIVAPGVTVVFLDPIVINTDDFACDNEAGEGTYTAMITGGLPSYDNSSTYTVSGDVSLIVSAGENFTLGPWDDQTNWMITATDALGCTATAEGLVQCEKVDAVSWYEVYGKVLEGGNKIFWSTATEEASDYFVIERSVDGITFDVLGSVAAAGYSAVLNSYDFLDRTAPVGTAYYRVVEYDFDGTRNASAQISLTRSKLDFAIGNIVPVPARNTIEVTINATSNSPVNLEIHDLAGKLVAIHSLQMNEGLNTFNFDVSTYATGVYFATANNGTKVATTRFIKE